MTVDLTSGYLSDAINDAINNVQCELTVMRW
jgi:hypothetical protein